MDDMTSTHPNDRATDQRGGLSDTAPTVSDAAQSSAGAVASTVGDHATELRDTAAEQAGQVAQDAKAHAGHLLESSKDELRAQSDAQAAKVADGLRSLSSQLGSMADATTESGPVVDVTREAGQRINALAERLDGQGIQGVMNDITSMARRRPGTFLLGALATGFIAGRVLRTAEEVVSEGAPVDRPAPTRTTPGVPPLPVSGYLAPPSPEVGMAGTVTAEGR